MCQNPRIWLILKSSWVRRVHEAYACSRILMHFHRPVTAQHSSSTGGPRYPEKDNVSQIFQVKSLDKQETWYPTLQKTLWVLSQLHDFVKVCASLSSSSFLIDGAQPPIFEDIAQEAINICKQSLVSAADTIKGVKTNTSKTLDGELFLVRHLLILKEVTQNLDLVSRDDASRTVNLSAVTGMFYVNRWFGS